VADTRQGAVLTDQHRRRQILVANRADSELRRAIRLLDPADIDGTRAQWMARMVDIIARYYNVSQAEARSYLARYRLAEIGTAGGVVVEPSMNLTVVTGVLDATGPQALKRQVKQGASQYGAYQQVRTQIAAEARKMIMAGGRSLLRATGDRDTRAIGYRRVAQGQCCTFCAMLVSRGPAYTSEAKALAKGNGDPYHLHCHCTVEIIYGDWEPTEQEQQWADAYYDAAEAAQAAKQPRTAGNILWRMRQDGQFRDSPAVRNLAPEH